MEYQVNYYLGEECIGGVSHLSAEEVLRGAEDFVNTYGRVAHIFPMGSGRGIYIVRHDDSTRPGYMPDFEHRLARFMRWNWR